MIEKLQLYTGWPVKVSPRTAHLNQDEGEGAMGARGRKLWAEDPISQIRATSCAGCQVAHSVGRS